MEQGKENVLVIAGPSGSGKTTIGMLAADTLGYYHIDVGELCRYVVLRMLARRVDINSEIECAAEARRLSQLVNRLGYWPFYKLLRKWSDSGALSQPGLSELTSKVVLYPAVAQVIEDILRSFYIKDGYVMVGRPWLYKRVFPGAFFKVLLVAPGAERAARNLDGESQAQMVARDARDDVVAMTIEQLAGIDIVINTDGREPEEIALLIAVAACPWIPVKHRFVPESFMGINFPPVPPYAL